MSGDTPLHQRRCTCDACRLMRKATEVTTATLVGEVVKNPMRGRDVELRLRSGETTTTVLKTAPNSDYGERGILHWVIGINTRNGEWWTIEQPTYCAGYRCPEWFRDHQYPEGWARSGGDAYCPMHALREIVQRGGEHVDVSNSKQPVGAIALGRRNFAITPDMDEKDITIRGLEVDLETAQLSQKKAEDALVPQVKALRAAEGTISDLRSQAERTRQRALAGLPFEEIVASDRVWDRLTGDGPWLVEGYSMDFPVPGGRAKYAARTAPQVDDRVIEVLVYKGRNHLNERIVEKIAASSLTKDEPLVPGKPLRPFGIKVFIALVVLSSLCGILNGIAWIWFGAPGLAP